jgi:hypothetical protein
MRNILSILLVLILLALISASCKSSSVVVENDDMYFQKHNRENYIPYRRVPRYYDTPYYGWYNPYTWNAPFYHNHSPLYQPRTIIVIPKAETHSYGKRPDRSSGNGGVNIPLNRKRGRN